MTFLAHTFNFFFSATALFAPFLPFATRYKSMSEKISLLLLSYFPPIPHIKKNYTSKR